MSDNLYIEERSSGTLVRTTQDTSTLAHHQHTIDSIGSGATFQTVAKAEDDPHASGDYGYMALTVRQNSAAALSGTDADYQPLITDGSGRLWCIAVQSGTWNIGTVTTVTTVSTVSSVSAVIAGTGATNLGKAVDSPVGGTDTGVAALVQRVDTPASLTPAANDYTRATVDSFGRMHTVLKSGTASVTSVGDSASSVTLLSSNASRTGATIYNDSTALCYVKCGTTASTSDFTFRMAANAREDIPAGYTGRIDAIWDSDAGGSARVTEFT